MKKERCLALLSGGLDSTLAVKTILDQDIDVAAINFITPFCNCTGRSSGCKHQASMVAEQLGIEIKVKFKGMEYVEIIKNPVYGYGKNMNPCVDCRIFMHREAKKVMEEIGASFLITGEVLGQRPMSQRRDTLRIIERDSGLEGLIVRPLSAKLFPPTIPELKGIIDRNRLLAISGRSRRQQIDAADSYGLNGYLCAAGGCLLTDINYSKKIRDLFKYEKSYNMTDIKLLKIGRHFRINEMTKVILGRKQEENDMLNNLKKEREHFISPVNFPGPAALIKGNLDSEILDIITGLILHYSKPVAGDPYLEHQLNRNKSEFKGTKRSVEREIEEYRI
ncbi:MAG: hypothetical protein ACE5EA_04470 [Nitrospirota bacterium]